MTRKSPHVEEPSENELEVGSGPKSWAAGVPGVYYSMKPAIEQMGLNRTRKTVMAMNQKDGFDCMSCAWPDPDHRKAFEFCENGAKAVTWEATPVRDRRRILGGASGQRTARTSPSTGSGMQGRLTEPVYKPAGEDHYKPVSWDAGVPASSRTSSRAWTPPTRPRSTPAAGRPTRRRSSTSCSSAASAPTTCRTAPTCATSPRAGRWARRIGIGKATVAYDDFAKADLIIIMGQNPGTNHPRMLTALEEAKDSGGEIVAVNPLPEAGLRRYKNPQKVKGIIGHGTEIADQFLQIRHRRRHGAAAGRLQARARRRGREPRARSWTTTFLDGALRRARGAPASTWPSWTRQAVLEATGLRSRRSTNSPPATSKADKVIITWAMGITQQKKGVATIKEIINLLLLRGNIGKPGAGASPIRGHSNVQGDRTMGIWEQMPQSFLDALGKEFGFEPPREHGADAVRDHQADARRRDQGVRRAGRQLRRQPSPTPTPPRPRWRTPSCPCRSRRSSTGRTP